MRVSAVIKVSLIPAFCCCCCFFCNSLDAAPTVESVLSKAQSKPPVQTRMAVRTGDTEEVETQRLTLLGRDGDFLLAQDTKRGAGLIRLHKARVTQCEFLLDYEPSDVATALQARDWAAAVRTLSPVVNLVRPYLDITDNNGLEPTMDLGLYMVSSADREIRNASGDNARRERALQQYDAACNLFLDAGKAEWSPFGRVAQLKACHALFAQGKIDKTTSMLEEIGAPFPGDDAYGHYWLVQAELLNHAQKSSDALDAAVKSVVFADKDVETFPSSLLLSADCYAKLGQYHRARDVYYEVAILFVGTDWETDALTGLAAIMADKKSAESEKAAIESVFFNLDEDMNKLATKLLEERKPDTKKAR